MYYTRSCTGSSRRFHLFERSPPAPREASTPRHCNNGLPILPLPPATMNYVYLLSLVLLSTAVASEPTVDLHRAAYHGNLSEVVRLIEGSADVDAIDEFGSTPLHYATNQVHVEVVIYLLENGARVDTRDASGMTALHYAVSAKGSEISRLLLERGADPNIRANAGQTALNIAVTTNRAETIRLLSRYDAELGNDRNQRTQSGNRGSRFDR